MLRKDLQAKWLIEKKKARRARAPWQPPRPARPPPIDIPEMKALNTALSFNFDNTAGTEITSLNLVTQGDSFDNRDGATIKISSLEIVGRLFCTPAAATSSAPTAYMWVVLDRQPNGAAATGAGANTAYLTSTDAPTALPVIPMQYRFKTVWRMAISLPSQAGVSGAYNGMSAPVHFYKKFKKPIEVRFSANTSSIADIQTNNFFIVAGLSDADDTVTFNGTSRIRFTG